MLDELTATLDAPQAPPEIAGAPPVALRVRQRGQAERVTPLAASKTTIGSSPQCTVCLPGADVRPLQCLVTLEADAATVTRWAAGVLLNGSDFRTAPLRAGDRLTVGSWEIEFEAIASVAKPAAPAAKPTPALRRSTVSPSPSAGATLDEAKQAFTLSSSAAAHYTFTDRFVLDLWQARHAARSRTRDLLAAVRGARAQVLAVAADLAVAQQDLAEARDAAKLAAERAVAARLTIADARKTTPANTSSQPTEKQRAAEARAAALAERLAGVERDLTAARLELAQRTDELARLTEELAAEADAREHLAAAAERDRTARTALESELAVREDAIRAADARLQALDDQIAAERASTGSRDAQLAELTAQLVAAQSAADDDRKRLAEIEGQLTEREQRAAAHAGESSCRDAELAALRAELESVRGELAESSATSKRVAGELAASQASAKRLAAELAEIQEASRRLAEELSARMQADAEPRLAEPPAANEPSTGVRGTQPLEAAALPAKDPSKSSPRLSWPIPKEPADDVPTSDVADTPAALPSASWPVAESTPEAAPATAASTDAAEPVSHSIDEPPVARFWSAVDFPSASADATPPRDADPTWSWGASPPADDWAAEPTQENPRESDAFDLPPGAAWASGLSDAASEEPADVRSTWTRPTQASDAVDAASEPQEAVADALTPLAGWTFDQPVARAPEHDEVPATTFAHVAGPTADAGLPLGQSIADDPSQVEGDEPTSRFDAFATPSSPEGTAEPAGEPQPLQPAAPEPVSFIERYRHLVESEGQVDSAASPSSRALLDDEFQPARRPTEVRSDPHEDSDEALDDYMAKLMARIRGDGPSESAHAATRPAPSAPAPVDEIRAVHSASVDQAEFGSADAAADSPLDTEPFEFKPIERTGRRAGRQTDLAALRAIANQTAISAIATHRDRRHVEVAYSRVVICGISAITSTLLMQEAPGLYDWKLWAGAVCAITGCWSATQLIRISRRRTADRSEFLTVAKQRGPSRPLVERAADDSSEGSATTAE